MKGAGRYTVVQLVKQDTCLLPCRRAILAGVGFIAFCGCIPPKERFPGPPLGLREATAIVNANIDHIRGTLRAVGSVDGKIPTSSGHGRSYHVDGVLFYLAPSHVRFDLKAFGDRQFLFGSNPTDYWVYSKQEERFQCGRYDEPAPVDFDLFMHPRDLIDALGLTPIPDVVDRALDDSATQPSGASHLDTFTTCVQRVVEDYQQILFLVKDPLRSLTLEREYWLDRHEPRLIRRVVFRDSDGVVTFDSMLDDYRVVRGGTALLPHSMTARWPRTGGEMYFRVQKWSSYPELGPDSVQFRTPRECQHKTSDR